MLLIVLMIIIGMVAMIAVYMLPTEPMEKHAMDAVGIMQKEGVYPGAQSEAMRDLILDNYTDALMLETAFWTEAESQDVIEAAVLARHPFYDGMSPAEIMMNYREMKQNYISEDYTRYWHGYLLILKPMLLVTGYAGIRTINSVLQILLMGITAFIIWRKLSWKSLLPYALTLVYLRTQVIYLSLQYSTVFYLMHMGVLLVLMSHRRLKENGGIYIYLILGCLTSFFDFLTYPPVTLGVPLVFHILQRKKAQNDKGIEKGSFSEASIRTVAETILRACYWCIGYAGMWAGKWLCGSLLLHRDLFADALGTAAVRTSTGNSTGGIPRTAALWKNLDVGFNGYALVFTAVLVLLLSIIWGIRIKKNGTGFLKENSRYITALLLTAFMPIIWYLVLCNHTYIHTFMTYRILAITVSAMTALLIL